MSQAIINLAIVMSPIILMGIAAMVEDWKNRKSSESLSFLGKKK